MKDHFDLIQFELNRADGWKLLKWNAVPSIKATHSSRKARTKMRKTNENAIEEHASCDVLYGKTNK